ncbi:hypothetical protein GPLA_4010 [Paraglaciecola polaris LMG 21857]|uniref:Uncharacterized protein n=1 Tax=Paraglaciecola polaris LMG 21857 TaxID=1129793 RepID=K6YQ81_9ALTE|nr:hypothetical protein GPLA_4010 [Paraglaciecola polaris LMG 21857]
MVGPFVVNSSRVLSANRRKNVNCRLLDNCSDCARANVTVYWNNMEGETQ